MRRAKPLFRTRPKRRVKDRLEWRRENTLYPPRRHRGWGWLLKPARAPRKRVYRRPITGCAIVPLLALALLVVALPVR